MDKTTYNILNKLSSSFGRSYSIHSLTTELNKDDRKTYYKTIFDKIKELNSDNDILIEKLGRSSIIRINYKNYDTLNLLSQLELMKKRNLDKDEELKLLLFDIDSLFRKKFCHIDSISIIRPEKNKILNRAEFLFILKDPDNEKSAIRKEIFGIYELMSDLGKMHNMKLDYLILGVNEFRGLISESDHNPLKEMLSSQIVLTYQENYWLEIKNLIDRGMRITSAEEINPGKISEKDLIYNLGRFGYKETGGEIGRGTEYCIEMIITALFLQGDARRIEAIPIILGKNLERGRKPIFGLLIFMAMKYSKAGKLLAYLEWLRKRSENEKIFGAIDLMTRIGIKPEKIDEKAIEQKFGLYNGN